MFNWLKTCFMALVRRKTAQSNHMAISTSMIKKPMRSNPYDAYPVILNETVRASTSAAITHTPVIKIPRRKTTFRAPDIMFRPHPTNDRKIVIGNQVWKMAHKVNPANDGSIAYRRPHHPNGPVRWCPPQIAELAAA